MFSVSKIYNIRFEVLEGFPTQAQHCDIILHNALDSSHNQNSNLVIPIVLKHLNHYTIMKT
jgi:hypothetical protein